VSELHSGRAGQQTVELSYLSGGLSWKADYVAELNANDSALDLNGWVTLTNKSGTAYPNAKLQLVAGDVNRVRDEMRFAAKAQRAMAEAASAPRQDMARSSSSSTTSTRCSGRPPSPTTSRSRSPCSARRACR
jgi:hypothetical protein